MIRVDKSIMIFDNARINEVVDPIAVKLVANIDIPVPLLGHDGDAAGD